MSEETTIRRAYEDYCEVAHDLGTQPEGYEEYKQFWLELDEFIEAEALPEISGEDLDEVQEMFG